MKKLMKSLMLFAAAAMALTSCENEAMNEGIEENGTYTMTFVAGAPESKTAVNIDGNTAKYTWSTGDKVAFIQSAVGIEKTNKKNSKAAVINGNTATFTTEFDDVDGATAYNYGAYYPTQEPKNSDKTFDNVIVSLPASQDITDGSYDPSADLMMSKPILNKTNDGHGGNLEFTRLIAIGKMTLKGVTAGETINKVVITFDNEVVNGDVTLNFDAVTAIYAETGNNTITLSNGELTALVEGTPLFFTCFPGEYTGAYSVEVTTDKATYTTDEGKSISESKPLEFTAGNVTAFNLTVGNRVEPDESGEVTIVASEQGIGNDTAVETLTAGPITVTFNKGSNSNAPKYYSSGTAFRVYGGNYFTVSSEKAILSVELTFGSNDGTNAITTDVESYSDGTWTGSANSVTFTVGGSTGNRRIAKMVITYGKPDTREALATPEVEADWKEETKEIAVTWADIENAGSYTLSYGKTVVEDAKSPYVFKGEYSTTYEFSVVAVPSDDTTYKNSAAGTAKVTTTANPETPSTKCYVKVTSAPSDWSGTYLIVYEGTKIAFDGSLSSLDASGNSKSVTINNSQIEATDAMNAISFTIAKNGNNYTIKSKSGKYIGNNSNSNSLTASASALNNTITFVNANDITIKSSGGAYLRYNANTGSGNLRFRYYKSSSYTSQKAIQLYKLQD